MVVGKTIGSLNLKKEVKVIVHTGKEEFAVLVFDIRQLDISAMVQQCKITNLEGKSAWIERLEKEDKDKLDKEDIEYIEEEKSINILELQLHKAYYELVKLRKLIFMSFINAKDLSKMGALLIAKYNTILGSILETQAELVELGRLDEGRYLEEAKDIKDAYNRLERQIEFYNNATELNITNDEIKFGDFIY
jgi:hypothetical protein